MADCDGFFRNFGIGFTPAEADAAVFTAHKEAGQDQGYAKWLIMCWFDTTYGQWTGDKFDNGESRSHMSAFLATTKYATFEELLASPPTEG